MGFAFDPNFATNHYIYVNYTRSGDGATVIARYTWDGTNTANLNTAKIILTVPQPAANHNGGMIAFGSEQPNPYLYIAFGDGGGGNDQFNNGQNLNSLLAQDPAHRRTSSQRRNAVPRAERQPVRQYGESTP